MIRRILVGVFVFAAFAASASVATTAQQTRDTYKPVLGPTGTGTLSGVVTNDDGSRPVKFAYVLLLGTSKGTVKVSSTDADGKFMFTGLPADRYTVGASKPPYLGTIAGARRAARPGTPIVLADGQKVANVAIRMPMGAAITGVVTDEKGQSAAGVAMELQQWRMQGGERTLVSAGRMYADDRGRYRFFGLQPGEYVVSAIRSGAPLVARVPSTAEIDAAMRGGALPAVSLVQPSAVRYAPVFYPGTTRVSDAQAIAVAAGDERPNVDFRLELVQSSRIEGVVVSADGQPLAGPVSVVATGRYSGVSLRTTPDGRFTGTGLLPGDYVVSATGNGPTAGQFGSAAVTFAGADVLGVQIVLRPAMTMAGTLQFRGDSVVPVLTGRRISIRNTAPNAPQPPAVTPANPTGAFTVSNLFPGRYSVSGLLNLGPTTDSITWALDSVLLDGRDVTDLPIDLTGETPPANIVVTFTDRFQELSGRLARSTGAPVSEHTIIVFPEDKAYWVGGSRRILIARPGTDGKFTLSGAGPTTLPPGKYLLAAVTDIDRDE